MKSHSALFLVRLLALVIFLPVGVSADHSFMPVAGLTADDGAEDDWFGSAVAVDENIALVGAWMADVEGNVDQGTAYIFTRDETGWVQQGKLIASDGTANDHFGYSVALDGDTALVGAWEADIKGKVDQGAVYVFVREGTGWIEQKKLIATDGAANDQFGISVALDGETALVGAFYADVAGNMDQGAAYVFTHDGSNWIEQARLSAADGAEDDWFGSAVALDENTALVGAWMADVEGNADQGAAYTFTRNGTEWMEQDRLTASDGAAFDHFGYSVALDGVTALVGAFDADLENNEDQGAAYIFERTLDEWVELSTLTASNGAAFDDFGISVALDGETALVGAWTADLAGNIDQGAAYVFSDQGTGWMEQDRLTAGDAAADDRFGYSTALDGDVALAGAYRADVGDNVDQGAAYLYERQALGSELYIPILLR